MPSTMIADVRAQCKELGIPFSVVRDCKQALQEAERLDREREIEIRKWAWTNASTRRSWPFWRHGFRSRYGKRVDRSDYTAIPRYDFILQQVAEHFPEFDGPDGEDKLFALLFSPYRRLSTPAELWSQAIVTVHQQQPASTEVPF